MKNMKISAKLIVSFLIVTAFSIALACIGIFASISINNNYTYLLESPVERQNYLSDMRLQFTMMRYRTANYAMEVNNPDIITNTLTPQFQSAYTSFFNSLNSYKQSNASDTRRDAATTNLNDANAVKLGELVEQFRQESESTRAIALSGDYDGATTALRSVIPLANEINALFDEMITPAGEYVHNESAAMDGIAISLTVAQIIVSVVCLVFSLLIAFYLSGVISKPLTFVKDVLRMMGLDGIVDFSDEEYRQAEEYAKANDEIGESVKMLIQTGRRLETVGNALETIASGDLTTELALLSERDKIGYSLQLMINNLNSMFGEIKAASDQVSAGAGQVSQSAQELATGSSEQAASVQELTAAVTEVRAQVDENGKRSAKALGNCDTAVNLMEASMESMRRMTDAMQSIGESSKDITRVIKVIDDIAFQTNILALNAAVEAARAGQHGKGFAVVADEVRNLAAKSAEAAKETAGLIEGSTQSVNAGSKIVEQTNESLKSVSITTNENAELIREMANSLENQTSSVVEINQGMNQISAVVQANSATSEQSAAAAEEMAAQSVLMNGVISRFKLKQSSNNFGLPGLSGSAAQTHSTGFAMNGSKY